MALSRRSQLITLASSAVIFSILLKFLLTSIPSSLPTTQTTTNVTNSLFTLTELSLYNGTDPSLPILLSILGSVFDVTRGRTHYGPGGAYNHFAGRDGSASFVTGNSTSPTDSLANFSAADVKAVVDWRAFYDRSYTHKGYLIGRYYDADGKATKHLKAAEAKAAKGRRLEEKRKKEEEMVKMCNSKWSQDEGGEVWCDDEEGGGDRVKRFPRMKVVGAAEIALTGRVSKRCVCLEEGELRDSALEVYEGCDFHATRCRV